MWVLIFVFFAALIAWSGVLWLLLTIDIFDYSMFAIVGMHLAPPLIAVAIWIGVRYWRKRRVEFRHQEQERERQEQREAERDKQKKAFDEALQQRRIEIECRWAAVSDLVSHTPTVKYITDTEQTRTYQTASQPMKNDEMPLWAHTSLLPMLEDLYTRAPLASGLPLAFCGPSNLANADLARGLRATHAQALRAVPIKALSTSIFDVFPMTIRGQSIHAVLLDLFASRPDLPGVVVVAFDSRVQDTISENEWSVFDEPAPLSETEKWCGKPGGALTLLLITPTLLSAVLAKMDTLPDSVALNAMTPHWERQQIPIGMASWLAQWPKTQRDTLAALLPVAVLHSPCSTKLTENLLSARNRQQVETTLMESAVNAGLVDPLFIAEGEVAPPAEPMEIENCGWLVHNAGDISHCGNRLALLFYAITRHGIEINHLEQANAVVPEFGDCGEVARWLWLTLAIQRAALLRQHVVLAEFNADVLSIEFVTAKLA